MTRTNTYRRKQARDLARFRRDTRNHRMTIRKDDDLYRHITVAAPGTSNMHFNITTVPGFLIYTGDMGSFTFSRTADMFKFMAIDWDRETPVIDYRYWAEKCVAENKNGGVTEYDPDTLMDLAVSLFRQHDFPEGTRMDAWSEFREDVLERVGDDEREDIARIAEFGYDVPGNHRDKRKVEQPFLDFYMDGPFRKHTVHFRWACWAIASTIRDYHRGGDRFTRQKAHDNAVLGGL